MRRAILGALVGAGLVVLAVGMFDGRSQVMAQRMAYPPGSTSGEPVHRTAYPPVAASSELIALPTSMGDKGQMLTVIDPKTQTIGVYWVEIPSGKITLRSVRNIHYDLQMTDFNGETPLPREIRLQLEQR